MHYILCNHLANRGRGADAIAQLRAAHPGESFIEMNVIGVDLKEFFAALMPADRVYLIGGDGSVNQFANRVADIPLHNEVYLYKSGTGNDFLRDINKLREREILLNPYLKDLPTVSVNGKCIRFVNGAGCGIDGAVCSGVEASKRAGKNGNYTAIALKTLISGYHCPEATVETDGTTRQYRNVWMCSAMKGRFCGGGMMLAPQQNRSDGLLTCFLVHDANPLQLLPIFPSIFKGTHIRHTRFVQAVKCRHIRVSFSLPVAMQIDGEVIENVSAYEAFV